MLITALYKIMIHIYVIVIVFVVLSSLTVWYHNTLILLHLIDIAFLAQERDFKGLQPPIPRKPLQILSIYTRLFRVMDPFWDSINLIEDKGCEETLSDKAE